MYIPAISIVAIFVIVLLISYKGKEDSLVEDVGKVIGFGVATIAWIAGLVIAPLFALLALSADSFNLGFVFGAIGFIAWSMLIEKIKGNKENTDK